MVRARVRFWSCWSVSYNQPMVKSTATATCASQSTTNTGKEHWKKERKKNNNNKTKVQYMHHWLYVCIYLEFYCSSFYRFPFTFFSSFSSFLFVAFDHYLISTIFSLSYLVPRFWTLPWTQSTLCARNLQRWTWTLPTGALASANTASPARHRQSSLAPSVTARRAVLSFAGSLR